LLSFPPVSGTYDSNFVVAVRETDSKYSSFNISQAIVSLFLVTVAEVFKNDTLLVKKGQLSQGKGSTVFFLVLSILVIIPLEVRSSTHEKIIYEIWLISNIKIWFFSIP